MGSKKRRKKHKANHYVITISDHPCAKTHSRRLPHGMRRLIFTAVTCVVLVVAAFVGLQNYNTTLLQERETSYLMTIEKLDEEIRTLAAENEVLNDKILILSETVNEKAGMVQAIEERSIPTGFPLSVAADIVEKVDDVEVNGEIDSRPVLEFTAPEGTFVVAAGDGVVSMVAEEIYYGWEVKVDHGNGYVTSYRTNVEPIVKVGDELARGGLLFEMKEAEDDETPKLGYQMIFEEKYINPMELLEING